MSTPSDHGVVVKLDSPASWVEFDCNTMIAGSRHAKFQKDCGDMESKNKVAQRAMQCNVCLFGKGPGDLEDLCSMYNRYNNK